MGRIGDGAVEVLSYVVVVVGVVVVWTEDVEQGDDDVDVLGPNALFNAAWLYVEGVDVGGCDKEERISAVR